MLQSLWRVAGVLCQGRRDEFEFPPRDAFEASPDYRENAVLAAAPEAIAAFLEDIPADAIRRTVCILDLSSESTPTWRIIQDMHSLRPTWLTARFPDVYWIFIVRDGAAPRDIAADAQGMHFVALDELSRLPELLSRHAGGFRSWFDPYSLRASALLPAECGASCLNVGLQGLVFDDEATFATFNGYFLYRQGIPTRMVATVAEFETVKDLDKTKKKFVTLEDVELNFENAQPADKDLYLPAPKKIEQCLAARLIKWGVK